MSGEKKPSSDVTASKMRRKRICLDVKLQMLRQLEAGGREVDVGASLDLAMSTIRRTTKKCRQYGSLCTYHPEIFSNRGNSFKKLFA